MPRGEYETYVFTVDNTNVGLITLQQDIIDRFNVTGLVGAEAQAATAGTRERKAHSRKVYTNRNTASTTRTVNVARTLSADIKRKNRVNTGKKIKVPLDLVSTSSTTTGTGTVARQTARFTTINFPQRASNYQVARWINTHFAANKPSYFITPNGARFPVNIPQILNQTTGEPDTTPTP
jgi:hypothetical protein